jgi:hydrogenase nickel incorporation protein HypA/HybF
MHELSIACNLVEIADSAARDAGAARVDVVHLRLGLFSGVVKEALLFSYDIVTQGTLLENSRLEIEDVPLAVFCPVCMEEKVLSGVQLFQCPTCGTPTSDIRRGKEIEIVSVEIPDETENSRH